MCQGLLLWAPRALQRCFCSNPPETEASTTSCSETHHMPPAIPLRTATSLLSQHSFAWLCTPVPVFPPFSSCPGHFARIDFFVPYISFLSPVIKTSKPKISVQVGPVCGCCLRSLLHRRAIFLFYSHKHMFPSCFWNHIYISERLHDTSLYLATKTWEQGYHFSSPSLYYQHLAPHLVSSSPPLNIQNDGWMDEWVNECQAHTRA